MRLLAVCFVVAWFSARAVHACDRDDPPPLFQQLDAATDIAEVRITAIAPGVPMRADRATVAVIARFKGAAGKTIELEIDDTSDCGSPMKVGDTGIAIVERPYAMESLWRADTDLRAAIAAWTGAADDRARAAALVALITGDGARKPSPWAYDAAEMLARSPALLAEITSDERDRLVAAFRRMRGLKPRAVLDQLDLIHRFDAVSDVDALAKTIAGVKRGSPTAIAAFVRCERLQRALHVAYSHVATAKPARLAELCRTGKTDEPWGWWSTR
ncbi:MAG TPA: hypothetical protein VMJ10_03790 [Kofleriaceae bacterium]|nr:hypothetical protein [Kofleriaceae bacterium]